MKFSAVGPVSLCTLALCTLAFAVPSVGAPSSRGPGGVVARAVKCSADGIKDTKVAVTNPSMSTVTFTAKVSSTGGVGTPQSYTLQAMGVAEFGCTQFKQLYPGGAALRSGMVTIESGSDLRTSSIFVAKFKSMPVVNPAAEPLDPVGP